MSDWQEPPHEATLAERVDHAIRGVKTMQGRQEAIELRWSARLDAVDLSVKALNDSVLTGFRLLGVDLVARAQAAKEIPGNGKIPSPSHPALEELGEAADALKEGAAALFEAAEAHTRPEIPSAKAQTESERVKALEALEDRKTGERWRKIKEGILVEVGKALLLGGAGALVHWLLTR